jgi:hypothetical protein
MLPIWKDKLSIDEIILKWSLEMQSPAPSLEELVDFFVSAWWLGKLKGLPPFTTRLALLKAMVESARAGDWNGVVFITPEEAEGVEQSDGYLLITDLERPRVPVPSKDSVTYTDASCTSAYQKLSKIPSHKYYPERTVGFLLMEVHRDEFFSLLTEAGLELPKFWRPPTPQPPERERESNISRDSELFSEDASLAVSPVGRRRGPKPKKFEKTKQAMECDIQQGRLSIPDLDAMLEKEMEERYGVSRDTAREARKATLSEFAEKSNSDK